MATSRRPKLLKNSGRTVQYDQIHLFIFEPGNQREVVKFALGSDDFRILKKDIEFPLYSDNCSYLLAIVDCLIEVGYEGEKRYILCEFKPKLNSISAAMGQIKIYKEILTRRMFQPVHSVIITFEGTGSYDDLLAAEGIKVFRIGSN